MMPYLKLDYLDIFIIDMSHKLTCLLGCTAMYDSVRQTIHVQSPKAVVYCWITKVGLFDKVFRCFSEAKGTGPSVFGQPVWFPCERHSIKSHLGHVAFRQRGKSHSVLQHWRS